MYTYIIYICVHIFLREGNMDTIVQMVLDNNWTDLTNRIERQAASKIEAKISEKKAIIIDRLNANFDKEE